MEESEKKTKENDKKDEENVPKVAMTDKSNDRTEACIRVLRNNPRLKELFLKSIDKTMTLSEGREFVRLAKEELDKVETNFNNIVATTNIDDFKLSDYSMKHQLNDLWLEYYNVKNFVEDTEKTYAKLPKQKPVKPDVSTLKPKKSKKSKPGPPKKPPEAKLSWWKRFPGRES